MAGEAVVTPLAPLKGGGPWPLKGNHQFYIILNFKEMLINGQEYAYADLQFSFLGNFNVAGVNAISWRSRTAKANVNGAGREPVARTRGGKEYEGSITLHSKEFFRLVEANGFNDLDDIPPFNLTVAFANGIDPVKTVVLPHCEFNESGLSATKGDVEIATDVPIIFTKPLYQ